MPIYVPGKLVLRQTWQPMDPDAAVYIAAVEAADGQALEERVKIAIDDFVLGCKADGIWSAIKASCILAGARTLNGALVPLVGAAPTNFNFVAGDYNRKTGLVGNGSTKYLNSNRSVNSDPQSNHHLALYASSIQSGVLTGGRDDGLGIGGKLIALNVFRSVPDTDRSESYGSAAAGSATFTGFSRSSSASYTARVASGSSNILSNSTTPDNVSIFLFGQNTAGTAGAFSSSRLAFYSIGESLNLALLDTRVTALINAFAAAIP